MRSGFLARLVGTILIATLWAATLAVAILWLIKAPIPFEPEPITVVLGLISTAITGAYNQFIKLLEKEEYSIADALAYGYVNNFLEPAITTLLSRGSTSNLRFYIYLPENLDELSPKAIDRTIARIRSMDYESNVINLDFGEGRTRDIINLLKASESLYFDFPKTLTTLVDVLEYKLENNKGNQNANMKAEAGKRYIDRFRMTLQRIVHEKNIDDAVYFVKKDLNFDG